MKYVIANWKAHKTVEEAKEWLEVFTKNDFSLIKDQFHVIICAPYHTLTTVKATTDQYIFMSTGSQDLSRLTSGSYTGEITAQMLYGLVDYTLIGHSERRNVFHESNEDISQKAKQAKLFNIEPIVCIRSAQDIIPIHTKFILYEPTNSIGTGNNEPLEAVLHSQNIIDPTSKLNFIYGGSVNELNIREYLSNDAIHGVCIGTAAIDPTEFYDTIKSACI